MPKELTYYDNSRRKCLILVDDQIRGIGPLDQLYELRFVVKIDEEILFHASMRATDEFLRFLFRTEYNRTKPDYNVLLDFGLLKVKTAIESNIRNNISFVFRTDNGPNTFELWEQVLLNEYAWSKIELIKFGEEKYLVFNGKKHYIPDPITRCALGFRKGLFVPKTQKEIDSYESAKNVDEINRVQLIRQRGHPDPVYAVFKVPTLEKRHVPNPATLEAIGRTQDDVDYLTDEDFNTIPTGKELQSVNHWDIETLKKEDASVNTHQNINISGPIGQFNAGNINHPVSNTDQRQQLVKKHWWENTFLQVIFLISALAGIITLVVSFFNKT